MPTQKKKDEDEAYRGGKACRTKKEKDPNQPKRPMSAYFMFLNDRRKTVKDDHPSATMAQQTKIMTDEWKALTPQDRLKYD